VLNPRGQILKVCTIDNYDLRYEFYPSSEEMITIGAFYKHMLNPIQRVVVNGSIDSRAFSFNNAKEAYVAGIELDVRKSLGFINRSSFFKDLDLVANASYIQSQVTNGAVINQAAKTPLQGQSPYVINAGFYYQSDSTGWQASILYNVFGPRIFLYGTNNYPSYIEMPRNSLDVTVSKKISKRTSLTVGVQNLLNQAATIIQDTNADGKYERPSKNNEDGGTDKLIMSYKQGTYFTLGVKINL
jgi:outer membrane receptor protein involved in Fe transport